MEKHPLTSKAIWGGIIVILSGVYGFFTKDPEGATAVAVVGLGFMGIGFRAAMQGEKSFIKDCSK